MAWKPKEQYKAKKYVREEVAKIEQSVTQPLEERVQRAEEEFSVLMERSSTELQIIEKQKEYLNRYPIVRQRLVALYVTGNYTQTQLAKILKVSPATIHKWLHDEDVLNAIQQYQREEDIINPILLRQYE
jgi:DNA-directed RNA polymerase specialized sigma24 family protein